jgi:K(+)-stimulated pyrophosphate-energized sodium pump
MIVAGIGNILSILGCYLVRCKEGADQKNLLNALLRGTWSSSAFIVIALAAMAGLGMVTWGVFGAVAAGLIAGVIIGKSTEYYTSDAYEPTRNISKQALTGPATVIIAGLGTGMLSSAIPVVTTVVAILAAFGFSNGFTSFNEGLYGVGFSAVGMLATLGITLATDAYGPIADNAGGNAEMSGLPKEVRERTDALDSLGNTTAATGKGFAIGSAALTAMALLAANVEEVKIWLARYAAEAGGSFAVGGHVFKAGEIAAKEVRELATIFEFHLLSPFVICGLFIGAMMVLVFCALTMSAVGQAAGAMVEEVRRQFREKPGIMEGKDKPDYARCVAISTAGAQRRMIVPSLLAIVVPIATGLVLGLSGVMGLLAGGLACGFAMACLLNNAGGAWDNAKKYIEKGNYGGKKLPDGSKNPVHGAAVIGDTVGDPCKDTSGPSLNILVKLMSMVTIVFTPVILKLSPVIQKWLHLTAS